MNPASLLVLLQLVLSFVYRSLCFPKGIYSTDKPTSWPLEISQQTLPLSSFPTFKALSSLFFFFFLTSVSMKRFILRFSSLKERADSWRMAERGCVCFLCCFLGAALVLLILLLSSSIRRLEHQPPTFGDWPPISSGWNEDGVWDW